MCSGHSCYSSWQRWCCGKSPDTSSKNSNVRYRRGLRAGPRDTRAHRDSHCIASLIWVPIGVWVGTRSGVTRMVQPVAQFLAAFPANLLFPIVVSAIVALKLNPDIWLSPLMILGTQWYILFNVVAGAAVIPAELRDCCANLQVRGWLWWRTTAFPAVFPYYVTGAITASGGSWNASIVAEVASWGDQRLQATGSAPILPQRRPPAIFIASYSASR